MMMFDWQVLSRELEDDKNKIQNQTSNQGKVKAIITIREQIR